MSSKRLQLIIAQSNSELKEALAVRRAVFINDIGLDEEIVFNSFDESVHSALHCIGRLDGDPVVSCRIRYPECGGAKLERMGVIPGQRGKGIGTAFIQLIEEHSAVKYAFGPLWCSSKLSSQEFYRKLGWYQEYNSVKTEAAIPHCIMVRRASRPLDQHPQLCAVSLPVSCMQSSVDFYRLLGFSPISNCARPQMQVSLSAKSSFEYSDDSHILLTVSSIDDRAYVHLLSDIAISERTIL